MITGLSQFVHWTIVLRKLLPRGLIVADCGIYVIDLARRPRLKKGTLAPARYETYSRVLRNTCSSISTLALALNSLRKDGSLPYLLPRSFAGETREGEQAVIYQQPAN